ncbi:hypothetical protein PMIN06_001849 [Paraphaeosphaeria minitans]
MFFSPNIIAMSKPTAPLAPVNIASEVYLAYLHTHCWNSPLPPMHPIPPLLSPKMLCPRPSAYATTPCEHHSKVDANKQDRVLGCAPNQCVNHRDVERYLPEQKAGKREGLVVIGAAACMKS